MHCIHNIYITKDDGSFEEIPHLKLPQEFVLFVGKPKGLKKDRLVAKIETDYFGGCGDQTAQVWDDKKLIYNNRAFFDAINGALELLDVECESGKDEFDTLGLGKYRENHEIEELIYNNI